MDAATDFANVLSFLRVYNIQLKCTINSVSVWRLNPLTAHTKAVSATSLFWILIFVRFYEKIVAS